MKVFKYFLHNHWWIDAWWNKLPMHLKHNRNSLRYLFGFMSVHDINIFVGQEIYQMACFGPFNLVHSNNLYVKKCMDNTSNSLWGKPFMWGFIRQEFIWSWFITLKFICAIKKLQLLCQVVTTGYISKTKWLVIHHVPTKI